MNNTLISVVIPVYNVETYLQECMDSILRQTLTQLEIICVDDGSTDRSANILDDYARRDNRVRVIHQKNAGPGAARNCGLRYVHGEYLIFLDSDDWFEPAFLETMLERAEHTQADIVICGSDTFQTGCKKFNSGEWMLKKELVPGSIFSPKEIPQTMFQFSYGWPWDKFYRTDFLKKYGLDFPKLPNSEDLVFIFPSLVLAESIAISEKVLVHHRINRSSSVSNSRHRSIEAPLQAVTLFRQRLIDHGLYQKYEQSFLNWAMDFLTWNAANLGHGTPARQFYHAIKNEWFAALQFETHGGAYYFDKRAYLKYKLIKYVSYPIFIAVVYLNKCLKISKERNSYAFQTGE